MNGSLDGRSGTSRSNGGPGAVKLGLLLALLAAAGGFAWLANRGGHRAPAAALALTERPDPAAPPADPAQTPAGVTSSWLAEVAQFIEQDQQRIHQHADGTLVANSLQDFRGFFGRDGLTVVPPGTEVGSEESAAWLWTYTLRVAGREGSPMAAVAAPAPSREENRVTYDRGGGITEVWENREDGLEHRFYIARRPAGAVGEVVLEGEMGGTLTARGGGQKVILRDGGGEALEYGKLAVYDARGRALPAAIEVAGTALRLRFDDRDAAYPIVVDPLLANPSWIADPTDQAGANFGLSVNTAGDVNGDGYSDVIVGAPYWDGAAADEGRACVYHGSATGLSPGASPDWTGDPTDQAGAYFGLPVSTAGDVNGDGYSDVIVGASYWDGAVADEGRAYVYHGSATGLSPAASPNWTADPTEQPGAQFGSSVSTAGDVNGDGYSDVIVGAYQWDGATANEGRVYVYHGSATGLSPAASPNWTADPTDQASANFGYPASTAGDVNGDGYSDVIVGAYNWDGVAVDEGRAYVYHGSATGLSPAVSPDWIADPTDQAGALFGYSLSTAGDVNGDGYSDVIVAACWWGVAWADEGRAYVYHGSATGLSPAASPDWTADPTDVSDAVFGYSVSTAGDVNGDGYGDVIVGAPQWDGAAADEGRAYVYHGSATGLSPAASPDWTADPTDQTGAGFCYRVSTAGDVNGDGYSDVIVGVNNWDGAAADEGRAYVYYGSGTGLAAASAWTADPTDQASASFGYPVRAAGDVNGDGYSDVIVGAYLWDGAATGEGRAYVYHGSATGLSATPNWTADPTDEAGGNFGYSVSTAGDVNGDGYSDVVVGANYWDGAAADEGRAYVYHGSATGLSATPNWTADPTDQASAHFGYSVSTAGDVNGDGYSDVIVGARIWDGAQTDEGRAYVFHGSATGLSPAASPDWTADPTDQAGAQFGQSVSTAGDVNGDGYSDVIVGADRWNGLAADEGRAYVYHGSATGLSPAASPDWTADPTDQAFAYFGVSVSTAGDVNGDGYSDVIVGAHEWDGAAVDEGRAYVFHGSATGLSPAASPDWTADPTDQAFAYFGVSVSTAGDVNGDGYSDVIVGAYYWDGAAADEGRAYVYYGNGGAGLSVNPRQARGDGTALIQLLGRSSGTNVRLRVRARSPAGRARVKLQWEIKPLGTLFNGTGLGQSSAWTDTGTAGVEIEELVTGLSEWTRYHWRARIVSFPRDYGHWVSIGPNGTNETDFLTNDLTPPTVTINQAGAQADPTNGSPINFTVTFSEPVTGLSTVDVTLGGTAGATTATVMGGPTTYNVAVSGMTGSGTVIATIAAGAAVDTAGNPNTASTSTDNTVTYDITAPAAGTVNDGGGADVDYQTSTTTISANWPGWSDAESGITGYEWAIGTTAGGQQVQAFASVGGSASATNSSLSLTNGQTYFVTVRATNGAGLQATATSDGVAVALPAISVSPAMLNLSAVAGGPNPASQTFDVTNSGPAGSTLAWTATWAEAWLSVAPTSGSLAAGANSTLTVSVNTTGLATGTYAGTITIADPAAPNTPQTVAVTLSVAGPIAIDPATTLPDAYAGEPYAGSFASTDGNAPISWSVAAGGLPPGLSLSPTTGAVTGTPTEPGTFAFTVQAADSSSPSPSLATLDATIIVWALRAPQNLSAITSDGRIDVSWDPLPGAAAYRAHYGTARGVYALSADTPINSVTLSGLDRNTTYFIVAAGIDSAGREGKRSVEIYGTPRPSQSVTHVRVLLAGSAAEDYRMIGWPVLPGNPDPIANLSDDLGPYDPTKWRLFRWDPALRSYEETPTTGGGGHKVAPGAAYWILSRTGGVVDVTGDLADTTQPFEIVLEPWWNMIGHPFDFAVDWELCEVEGVGVLSAANTLTRPELWDFNGGYVSVAQLVSGRGYWVKNLTGAPVTLSIPPIVSASHAKPRAAAQGDDLPPPPPGAELPGAGSSGGGGGGGCAAQASAAALGALVLLALAAYGGMGARAAGSSSNG